MAAVMAAIIEMQEVQRSLNSALDRLIEAQAKVTSAVGGTPTSQSAKSAAEFTQASLTHLRELITFVSLVKTRLGLYMSESL